MHWLLTRNTTMTNVSMAIEERESTTSTAKCIASVIMTQKNNQRQWFNLEQI